MPSFSQAVSLLWAPFGRQSGALALYPFQTRGFLSTLIGYYGIFIWLPGIFVERGFAFLRTYQNTFLLALA